MKILFTTHGKDWNAELDLKFGRSQGFLLYDEETKKISWHSNEKNIEAAHGAGIQAGQNAAELGADIVITGHVGPKAFTTLKSADIRIFTAPKEDTLKNIYEMFKNNKLKETTESH